MHEKHDHDFYTNTMTELTSIAEMKHVKYSLNANITNDISGLEPYLLLGHGYGILFSTQWTYKFEYR